MILTLLLVPRLIMKASAKADEVSFSPNAAPRGPTPLTSMWPVTCARAPSCARANSQASRHIAGVDEVLERPVEPGDHSEMPALVDTCVQAKLM